MTRAAVKARARRAKRLAEKIREGLLAADLDWTGVHILRALSAAMNNVVNREYMRAAREADPEKFRKRARDQYAADPAIRDRVKAQAKAWIKAHPLAKQADRLKYARRKAAAPGNFTGSDVLTQYNAQAGLCFYCIRGMSEMHIEHKTPLSRGGTNWPDNIVCACASCNLRKHNKTSAEFMPIVQGEMVANDREAA